MKKLKLFAALCCATLLFAACEKDNEPSSNNTSKDTKEAVDLGLSVKWATCNVGATKPEAYGNYYAWGETETKDTYSWDNYTYPSRPATLPDNFDAATTNWGGAWRMPTDVEWAELIESCTWTWTPLNGVDGYKVQAANGNSIFLPAAGYCNGDKVVKEGEYGGYWSSTPYSGGSNYANGVGLYSDSVAVTHYYRDFGKSVRPVRE